jgi:hypothetical protein
MRPLLLALLLSAAASFAQTPTTAPAPDPLASLDFLAGTWTASTTTAGSAAAHANGTYTFRRDLEGHALQRTSSADHCTAPAAFDCNHHDQLTIFPDPHGQALHHAGIFALYLDNEGHVIYYTVTTPDASTAVFNSQGPPTLPSFRLTYHLQGSGPTAVMTGKFQVAAPGSTDFHSYLEWTGTRQP